MDSLAVLGVPDNAGNIRGTHPRGKRRTQTCPTRLLTSAAVSEAHARADCVRSRMAANPCLILCKSVHHGITAKVARAMADTFGPDTPR